MALRKAVTPVKPVPLKTGNRSPGGLQLAEGTRFRLEFIPNWMRCRNDKKKMEERLAAANGRLGGGSLR